MVYYTYSYAITNPAVSQSRPYSASPVSLHPERLLKNCEVQKSNKYQALAESKGGDFSPLVVGTSGYITSSAKKALQIICSKQDNSNSAHTRYTYDYRMSKISFSLQKSVSTEIILRPSRASGSQSSSSSSRDNFPDSVDTHGQMSG